MNWFTEIVCAPRWTSLAWVMFGIAFVIVSLFERRRYFKDYSKALAGLVQIGLGMDEIVLGSVRRAVRLDRYEKALKRIAAVYDWHDSMAEDAVALGRCIEIAKDALGSGRVNRGEFVY